MINKQFPRVLILGAPFNKVNGGGITMSNLFNDWPKDNLALASTSNLRINADFLACGNYFQLGYKSKLHPFPLNVFLPKLVCGPVLNDEKPVSISGQQLSGGKYKSFYKLLLSLLNMTGLYNLLYNLKVTDDFIKWILNFNPDIIYSQLASLESIRIVNSIHALTNRPVAIHMMDDWPLTINKPSIFYYYWGKRIENEFRNLISKSKILMSISQGMSDEYLIRYGRYFQPFHNPIKLENWLPFSKNSWEITSKFKILYTGRLGLANNKSILLIAKVVSKLNIKNSDIQLDIFTPDYDSCQARKIKKFKGVNVNKTIEYRRMPELLSVYDLLVLPLDFDKRSVNFAKLSMPTKASEYMISRVPVLIFADSRTYLARHALENRWAHVITENSEETLARSIVTLRTDENLRKNISERAYNYALRHEDSEVVKENFRKCLNFEL
jgi:glycosyltransferase involved in cell wall biosynthesis